MSFEALKTTSKKTDYQGGINIHYSAIVDGLTKPNTVVLVAYYNIYTRAKKYKSTTTSTTNYKYYP